MTTTRTPKKEGSVSDNTDNESVDQFESVSAQNKERRMIRFSSDVKKSFDYTDCTEDGDDASEMSKRSFMEEILPVGELTETEQRGLAEAFGDLFCCTGKAELES
ncbi:unnamed protein product [Cylindrotheca closterium]|uniref:Uncharacterized protein n=1 Tax=Cylindrotheca closterium TaxID=2856 RepID=A0AAD2CIV7_9STRA|nr:unnamed protein product [Cylindrotheca closterium]